MDQGNVSALFDPPGVVWAKWGHADVPYPLMGHLLDSAAFAYAIWDAILSTTVRDRLSDGLWSRSLAEARLGFVFLVASHDCGKADPWFQGQVASRKAGEFTANASRLARAGLTGFPETDQLLSRMRNCGDDSIRRLLRHEAGSAGVLEWSGAPQWAAAAVSGHHGRYMPDAPPRRIRPVTEYRDWLVRSHWATVQQRDLSAVAGAIGWPGFDDAARDTDPRTAAALIPLMTGLICLADWCASDDDFLRVAPPLALLDSDPGEFLRLRSEQAAAILPETMGVPVRPRGRFSEIFPGFVPDRAVQRWAVDKADHGPGLTVITVPMGEGKTETALWMHCATDVGDGLVFALPTMATADAMFARVQSFYAGTPALGALRHGQAILNAFYDPAAARPTGVCDDEGGLTGSEWLRGRHRALTAPVTVSSCDQVLAGAVSHKFLPVRLASLASKHVVLDEVHTYDPYQDMLLTRLLGWLGRYGTRVTLLSATLPTRRTRDYVAAYTAGAGSEIDAPSIAEAVPGAYPSVTTATPNGVVTQVPVSAHRIYRHLVRCVDVPIAAEGYADYVEEFAAATATIVDALRADNPLACIGVIVNTVNRAIAIAEHLGGDVPLLVVHARMTARQRGKQTSALLEATGPTGVPGPMTVVATQIAEASLDIDVDILVTDLAPIASLLQRLGRQWRHSQPVDDEWEHRPGRVRSGDGPIAHVLVARDAADDRHRHAAVPYSQEEIRRALAEGLDAGQRDSFAVPDDLQRLVDACDVTLADLSSADSDQPAIQDLIAQLGRQAQQAGQAERVGIDLGQFQDAWEMNPAWSGNATLDAFTVGTLWDAEAVTRLMDGDSVQLLVYDPAGQTRYAYQGEAAALIDRHLTQQEATNVMGCVLPVSGTLAARIRCTVPVPAGWQEQPTAILRTLVPVSVAVLADLGLYLDPDRGLTSK